MNLLTENLLSIDVWLNDIRSHVEAYAPDIISILDIYIAEAQFGRGYIDSDLALLPSGARILEVGAGSLLLSCQLVREGFYVTALEPVGDGFTHFERLRNLVLDRARVQGCTPVMLNVAAEQLDLRDCFEYVFSINVMEHVSDVPCVVYNISRSMKIGARYRFTCPNYLFPYEPHFNIPTLFSKKLTERFLAKRIFNRPDVPDPVGTWKSLNWISVPKVASIAAQIPNLDVGFNQKLLVSTIGRVATDPQFSARRSVWLRTCLLILIRWRIYLLFGLIPAALQPIMDVILTKNKNREII